MNGRVCLGECRGAHKSWQGGGCAITHWQGRKETGYRWEHRHQISHAPERATTESLPPRLKLPVPHGNNNLLLPFDHAAPGPQSGWLPCNVQGVPVEASQQARADLLVLLTRTNGRLPLLRTDYCYLQLVGRKSISIQ